jgi:putative transcriptional regulator
MGKSKIKNNVRVMRFNHGEMTQEQLANLIGVSRQTIVAIEKNNYSPSLELALKISKVFNRPIEDIFFLED